MTRFFFLTGRFDHRYTVWNNIMFYDRKETPNAARKHVRMV